jgi:drug/metabolite transporter (DMT)-like permease
MLAVYFGVFAAVCWSVHDLIARRVAENTGPFRTALAVIILGGLFLTPYVFWFDGKLLESREAILLSLALGVFYALGIAGLFKAFSLGPVAIVAPLTASYPALVFLWGVATGLQPTLVQLAAVILTIAGSIIVARASGNQNEGDEVARGKFGLLLASCAICMLGYTLAVIVGQKAAVPAGAAEAAWISRFSASLVLLPIVIKERRTTKITGSVWAGIAAMALLDVLGLIAVNQSGHLPKKEFAAIGIATYGAIAVLLSSTILKERVSAVAWAGIAMIVAGIAVLAQP